MQLHLFHQILVQHEALEAGQVEISLWLDEAESLLNTLSLSGGKESVMAQHEKHKASLCHISCTYRCDIFKNVHNAYYLFSSGIFLTDIVL